MTITTAPSGRPAPAVRAGSGHQRATGARRRQQAPASTAWPALPAPAWTQWHDVVVVGGETGAIPVDAVVLGPTGVHVVTRAVPGATATGTTPVDAALAASDAVRASLPERYRHAVATALVVDGDGDGEVVGGVVVATLPSLLESVRLRPRVLSRSETGVLAAHLARTLDPRVAPAVRDRLWTRLVRRSRPTRDRVA